MLLKRLPLFARIYGIKPPDLDHMTMREISEFLVDLDRLAEAERGNHG